MKSHRLDDNTDEIDTYVNHKKDVKTAILSFKTVQKGSKVITTS